MYFVLKALTKGDPNIILIAVDSMHLIKFLRNTLTLRSLTPNVSIKQG